MVIEVNGREVQARRGEMLLATLEREGIHVPTLCHVEGLFPSGACRMCVVEVEGTDGLVPSCALPVREGMNVRTHTPRVMEARKTIVELLLADHPDDCLYCVRNGKCELQNLAEELGVRHRRYRRASCDWPEGASENGKLDISSPSIVRDPAKCILCGRCVRVCEEIQGVGAIDFVGRGSAARVGTAFEQGLNVSTCVYCGQCIRVCPTGALSERSQVEQVLSALRDPDKFVVVQHAPSVSVTLAEEFGMRPGMDICGKMTAALRAIGFDRVFETSFSADLTIMEEASELVQRIREDGPLPMMTSCSPGWVKLVEQFYPQFLPNISTCRSPQQMLGAVIKTFFAEGEGLDPSKIYSVSIMPCVAKKFEAERPEMSRDGIADVDAVLTTREFAEILRLFGMAPADFAAAAPDTPFGERSTAGKLFGATGGVMEAAVRTVHFLLTGKEMENLEVPEVRGMGGLKETRVDIGGLDVGLAVANGLGNARTLLDQLAAGRDDLHFIEVMTCPGGCIAGGGQPYGADEKAIKARMKALYRIDGSENTRTAHANASVQRLYREFLTEPLSPASHELLHTHYQNREVAL